MDKHFIYAISSSMCAVVCSSKTERDFGRIHLIMILMRAAHLLWLLEKANKKKNIKHAYRTCIVDRLWFTIIRDRCACIYFGLHFLWSQRLFSMPSKTAKLKS